jgi:hypothetical protein
LGQLERLGPVAGFSQEVTHSRPCHYNTVPRLSLIYMTYEQNIPFYISKYKDFPWKKYESEHYVFNVEGNSLAEKDIKKIKARQESSYLKITQNLKLENPDQKIIYYFYSSQDKKAEFMGDGWFGQTIYNEFIIHAVYNEEDKVLGEHEDTHLLSLQMGLPISFFQEGLAEAMVGSSMFGNEHNKIVSDGVKKGLSVDVKSLMSQQGWLDTPDDEPEFYYSIAGSFVKYLMEKLDLKTFKELYSAMDRKNTAEENIKIFELVTSLSFTEVESKWSLSELI